MHESIRHKSATDVVEWWVFFYSVSVLLVGFLFFLFCFANAATKEQRAFANFRFLLEKTVAETVELHTVNKEAVMSRIEVFESFPPFRNGHSPIED